MLVLLAEATIAGLGLGAVYATIAIAYTLIVASSGVFNFAQGSMVMAGGLGLLGLWQDLHWSFLFTVGIILLGGGLLGVISYGVSVGPVIRRLGSTGITEGTLITTFGFGLVLATLGEVVVGDQTYFVHSYVSTKPLHVSSVPINLVYIAMFATCLVLALVGDYCIRRTSIGLRLRAIVQDPEGAELMGIRVERLIVAAFGAGGALAALAGLLMAPVTGASVFVSTQFSLYGFVAMALGGYGSFSGAVTGGLLVGLITSWLSIAVTPTTDELVLYGLLVAFLTYRPRGLFGRAGAFGASGIREV